jgi:hypothetical protein
MLTPRNNNEYWDGLVAIARSAWTKRVNRTVRAASF